MDRMLKISISIVVYKPNLDVLSRALSSLHEAIKVAEAKYSIQTILYVVDNSCDPVWPKKILAVMQNSFPDQHVIRSKLIVSPENGGYGKANNLAINESESNYHLVMNPDVYLDSDAIVNAIDYLELDKSVGLLVPDVRGEDGERHFLCKRSPTLLIMFLRGFGPKWLKDVFWRKLAAFEMKDKNYECEIDGVEFLTGCFMFFRNLSLQELKGFDTDFFMYLEDADIGRRMLETAAVRYVPKVRVIHRWARGTHNNWYLRWVTIKSAFIYWKKWGGLF